MANERLPIKFFAKREIDELKVEAGGNKVDPKWLLRGDELADRSSELLTALDQFTEILQKRVERNSVIPVVFLAKMCDGSTAKSHRKDIVSLFQFSENSNVIGLSGSDELIVKLDSISQAKEISKRIQNYKKYEKAISSFEIFWSFQALIQAQDDELIYKARLIDFKDYEMNMAAQHMFENALRARKVVYQKSYYASQFPIYRISNISRETLDEFQNDSEFDMLFSIEPMPKYFIGLDSMDSNETIRVLMPVPEQRYETLGILDNGIASIPHLTPWIDEERWTVYPQTHISPTHGTFVAGVALYGDVCENEKWVGHKGIKLFDATVFPKVSEDGLTEDELIANIQEAIASNHEKVKVWNLSISISRPVSDEKFSDFAIALDALQEKYNVLICKSAGNCRNFEHGQPKGRIHEGADSVRSLVVGSVAHKKDVYDRSEIDNPSPFSRLGPGPEYIIKPEISHYGGNAGLNEQGKLVATGVKSFSANGELSYNVGTSFSTPRIASLATALYQELDEDFDPLLLKALIVHSASYSKKLVIPEAERTKQLGFGVPKNISEIIYNDAHEATLILRDTISKGQYIDIMDFPMPKSLIRNGFYTGQITATLVYDPILDPTQGAEYCQSNVDIKFGSYDEKTDRDISKRNILNPIGRGGPKNLLHDSLYSKKIMKTSQSDFSLRERQLIKYGDKYYPVKKYAVDLAELSEANKLRHATAEKQWYLYLRGLYREHIEQRAVLERFTPSQEVCLIITIRDPERKTPVYDEVTQGLNAFNFWHSNIKVSSDISITI